MSELNVILSNVNRFTTAELESLVDRSPYFKQAHLLLAKRYQLEGNPKFDQQLQLAALYTSDRELLYALFNEKEQWESTASPPATPVTEQEVPVAEPTEKSGHILPEAEPVIEPVTSFDDKLLTIDVDRADEVPLVLESAPLDEPIIPDDEDVLNTQAIGETEIQQQADEVILSAEEHLQQQWAETQPITETVHEDPATGVIVRPQEEPVQQQVTAVFATDQPHTFSEWLNAFSQQDTALADKPATEHEQATEGPAEIVEIEDELDTVIQENISSDYVHNLMEEETNYSKDLTRFIEEQIKKRKPAAVKKPADENDIAPEMITETMARIYEGQKKYNKAIKAYEVLSLKFPEKSGLFAARINYLKSIS